MEFVVGLLTGVVITAIIVRILFNVWLGVTLEVDGVKEELKTLYEEMDLLDLYYKIVNYKCPGVDFGKRLYHTYLK